MQYHLAVDIGASSGRHILGHLEKGRLVCEEIYRFENNLTERNGHLCWDLTQLFAEIVAGLRQCKRLGKIPVSMGIDTWGVDFVLLDAEDRMLGDATAYRDNRTAGMDEWVEGKIALTELYARTGIQKQIFNTVYQLAALRQESPEILDRAETFLHIPDYLHFLLTGKKASEYTAASTSALVNAESRQWDRPLLRRLGFPEKIFLPLSKPGTVLGDFSEAMQAELGWNCRVILPPSHDTASAFLAVPQTEPDAVFISSGTWSLLGVENGTPVTSEESLRAGFTNEGGYQDCYRYLKNIMGLWMIQSIRRDLNKQYSFAELETLARQESAFDVIIDVNDPGFLAPDSMIEAVRLYCERHGQKIPQNLGQTMQCVYRSLAACYADSIRQLESLTGVSYRCIHIVGGGTKDGYLNQLTADACGLPVLAGPSEGTAIGNLLAQCLTCKELTSVNEARKLVAQSFAVSRFLPTE